MSPSTVPHTTWPFRLLGCTVKLQIIYWNILCSLWQSIHTVNWALSFPYVCCSAWCWAVTVSTWWWRGIMASWRCGGHTTWTCCIPTLCVTAACAHWHSHTTKSKQHRTHDLMTILHNPPSAEPLNFPYKAFLQTDLIFTGLPLVREIQGQGKVRKF